MNADSRRGELAGPVLLIGFGLLLFLVNTGQVSLSIWEALAMLWPLALIAIGIDLVIPRRSVVASVAVAGLLLVVVLGGGVIALSSESAQPAAAGEAVGVPASDVPNAKISLSPAAGQLFVEAMEASGQLMAGTITSSSPGAVSSDVVTTGDQTVVSVSTVGPIIIPLSAGPGEVWDLEISPEPRVVLLASLGAGEVRIDGRGLNLESLDASVGVGRIEVRVAEGSGPTSLSAGVGELVIWVPAGVPVRLEASSILGVSVPPGYSKAGSIYESPDYQASGGLRINASLGIGSIRLLEY